VLKDIRRQTRRQYPAEEKIRIVLEGLRGEEHLRAVPPGGHCRLDVLWLVEGVPRGRQAPPGRRAATSGEVKDLRRETAALKEVVADLTLENRLLKKSMNGDGEDEA
jgi:transposase